MISPPFLIVLDPPITPEENPPFLSNNRNERKMFEKLPGDICLVSISGGIICEQVSSNLLRGVASQLTLGTDNKTTTLLGPTVDGLDDIDQLLLVFQNPVQLIVVTGAEITHHVFVTEEEHDCNRVVKLCAGVSLYFEDKRLERCATHHTSA